MHALEDEMASDNKDVYDKAILISSADRAYFHIQQQQIINCAMGLKYPIDLEALKVAFSNSIMIKHPRFCSLVVRGRNGREYWQRTRVNIDDHIIVENHQHGLKSDEDKEQAINAYLARLALLTQLSSENKPLWELHVLLGLQCVVLRVHHALGDGFSLMSMLSACFGPSNINAIHDGVGGECNISVKDRGPKRNVWRHKGVCGLIKSLWFTLIFYLRAIIKLWWRKDKVNVLSGGHGVEKMPRKIATEPFELEDFRSIKSLVPNVNMSELMPNVSNYGLSSWGNNSSFFLVPTRCNNKQHPLDHARVMKEIMDKKKQSYEAHTFYYTAFNLIPSCLGLKAITLHMVSYKGKADLQVMVAESIIPDPQLLANCFQESLAEMKKCINLPP